MAVIRSLSEQMQPETFTPNLVVLLPAYNEVERIGDTLAAYTFYLSSSNKWKDKSHVLVVDDGSDDGTADFVCSSDWNYVDCISLPNNQGKGAAVSFGIRYLMDHCNEEPCLVLIADADGSGEISSLEIMVQSLEQLIASQPIPLEQHDFWNVPALVVGNRGYDGSSLSRSFLRWGFRTTVRILCGDLRVCDSQCGFKLLTLAAAKSLYHDLSLQRWSHDVEVLYRAREWNIIITEEVVKWQDRDGSKLVTSAYGAVQASTIMLLEVLSMRIKYLLGQWKLPSEGDTE